MNADTGKLMRLLANEVVPEGFTKVPEHLVNEAISELGDKDSVIVDMSKNTPLICWAKNKQKNKKAKRKMVKASKRKNRK